MSANVARVTAALAGLLAAACSSVWGFEEGALGGVGGATGDGGAGGTVGTAGAAGDGAGATTTSSGGAGAQGGATVGTGGSVGGGGAVATGGSGGSPPPPECTAGQTQDVGDCAKCGDLIEHCGADGFWQAATCEGQGTCEVGDTAQSTCEACGEKVCRNDCTWSACQPDAGKQCLWEQGTNWRYCGGDQHHWQYCLDTCVWSTDCVYCEPYC